MKAATPLGLFVTSVKRTVVLDLDTGRPRCELPKGLPVPADEVVLVRSGGTMAAFDPWTGDHLHRFQIRGSSDYTPCFFRDGRLHITLGDDLVAHRFEDVRNPPTVEWRIPFPSAPRIEAVTQNLVIVSLERYLAGKQAESVALDVSDGHERFRTPIECETADDRLIVGYDAKCTIGLDLDGESRWKTPGLHDPLGTTSTSVVFSHSDGDRLLVVDRSTGEATSLALPFAFALRSLHRMCAVADDVVVCGAHDRLEGMDLEGRTLWTWPAPKGKAVDRPWVLPGRVYAKLGSRQVVCLEEV